MKLDFARPSTLALLLPVAIIAPAPQLAAQQDQDRDESYMGEAPERYAQVRHLEGDVQIRKGDQEESLERGTPISEGDVVESRGRGVLQLGDGSRLIFGDRTRFEVAALFTDRNGERQALIRLDYGQLRVMAGSESDARIQVDSPVGSALIQEGDDLIFDLDRDQSADIRVFRGRVQFSNSQDQTALRAGERLMVYGRNDRLNRVRSFNTYESDSFSRWSEGFLRTRRGESWKHVPGEIRYYSDDLDENGDWVFVPEYNTHCWRPRGIDADWRPYWRGRWAAYPGGMTWISSDPWGYVTHHHGRWGWHVSLGWHWIPGVFFSPAWVAWNTYDSYFGWAPLGYHNNPCHWGHGSWGGAYSWNVVHINHIHNIHVHRHIHSDRNIIHKFNVGTGASTWTSNTKGRSLEAPWRRSPLVVTRNEMRDPKQFQRVVSERPLMRQRIQTYERQAQERTGRSILRRDPATLNRGVESTQPSRENRTPLQFEDRSRLRERSILRSPENRRERNERTDLPERNGHLERRVETETPRDRRPLPKEVVRESPRQDAPRERPRPVEPNREPSRDRVEERRPYAFERPIPPREERRPDPPREDRRPEPNRESERPTERPRFEAPRQESPRQESPRYERPREEPSRQEAPRQESPRQEAPRREAPRQEFPRQEAPRQEAPSRIERPAPSRSPEPSRSPAPSRSNDRPSRPLR